jgi:DNA modification methylase
VDVKFGDIWKLGEHTLLCGDSTEAAMIEEVRSEQPVLTITDPPYGVSLGKNNKRDSRLVEIKIKNDHRMMWSKSFTNFNAPTLYCWVPSSSDLAMHAILDAGYQIRQPVVWVKDQFTLHRQLYHWKHETCYIATKLGERTPWYGDRKQSTVWEEKKPRAKERIHPAQKPLGVYLLPINNHNKKCELVADPFAGSGNNFIAC